MAKELAKAYDPSEVEDRTYDFWIKGGYFHAKCEKDKKPYTIVYHCHAASEYYGTASYGTRTR